MKKMNIQQKMNLIYKAWEKEDSLLDFMPDREMYPYDPDNSEHDESLCLECNSDWLAWEIELLD